MVYYISKLIISSTISHCTHVISPYFLDLNPSWTCSNIFLLNGFNTQVLVLIFLVSSKTTDLFHKYRCPSFFKRINFRAY